ncbi:hypothetical protein KEM55_001767 [Ascosphaera atra]|nr:hypothetical protein KEM55_001767 [Ascosphaera atra]
MDIPYFAQVLIKERLLPLVKSRMESEGSVNVLPLCLAFATDFICSYIFGLQNIPDFLRQEQERAQWLAAHEKSKNAGFWPGECPALTKNLHRMGIKLVPDEAARCREEVRQLCPQLMSRLERNDNLQEWNGLRRTEPTVYDQVAQNLLPTITQHDETKEHPVLLPRMSLASELMDHIKAGTETSGWSLVYVLHELSLRPEIQERLHQEIASVTELGLADVTPFSVDTTKSLDKLPLLDAILLETIRLHPAVAGSQPRIAPASVKKLGQDIPFSINGYLIPPGTRVSAQAYSLHRNEKVFPNAEVWDPNRWLNAQSDERSEMKRWFWGFGSGPMMCVGNSFAILGKYAGYLEHLDCSFRLTKFRAQVCRRIYLL